MRFLQTCSEPGCSALVKRGRCPDHLREFNRRREHDNPDWRDKDWRRVYKDPRWESLCRRVKREQPTCAVPYCGFPTTDVDHIVPMRDGGAPFDRSNVQGLCHVHHSSKTAHEVWGGGKT